MDFIVEGPDGKKYRVSGDSEEAVTAAIEQMFSAPAGGASPLAPPPLAPQTPGPQTSAQPSLVDNVMSGAKTVGGVADQFVRGLVGGAANVVGAPGDIGKITGTRAGPVTVVGGLPFLTSDAIKAVPDKLNDWTAGLLGVEPPKTTPDGTAESVAHRVGEEVGAMAVPVGGALKTGAGLTAVGARAVIPEATGTNIIGRVADFFKQAPAKMVESAAVNPGRFVQKEVGAATAAGGGAGLINEATGKADVERRGEHPTGLQQAGDIAGALAGLSAKGLTDKVVETGGHVLGALTGRTNTTNQVVRDVTTDEIARYAGLVPDKKGVIDTAPLADAIDQGKRVDETIPRFQESTADRTRNPGLAAAEYSRQSGPNSGQYAARRDANTTAVDEALATSEPKATPGAFRSELELERDRRLTDAAVNTANAKDDAARAVQPLAPAGTASARGNTVRTELETARETARDATETAYANANVDRNQVDPSGLRDRLLAVRDGLTETERALVPEGLVDRVSRLGQPRESALVDEAGRPIQMAPPPVDLKEATDLKSELLRLQRAALADPRAEKGGRNAARVLGDYVDAVDQFISSNLTAAEQQALDAARGTARVEKDAFTRQGDPVTQIVARNEGGTPRMRDENVATLSTRTDALDRILQQADTPATRQAIRDQLLSNADTASAEGIARFSQDYAEQLQRFPGLADELTRARTARGAQEAAQTAESDLMREIGPQGRGVVAKYLQYGDENAKKAMRGVIASKDPARSADELLSFVGDDPKAVEGARKVFWDILQEKTRSAGSTTKTISGTQPYLPGALKKFVDDSAVAAVAERLYRDNPEHWANIKKITEAMQGVDIRNAAKAPNTSGTPQGLQPGYLPSGETLASRIFAVERGVVSPAFAAINIAGIIARKAVKQSHTAAVDKAIDKALLEPDFAALLARENNPANRAALQRATKGWQANEASTLLDMLAPEDKDRDTKRAVMK